MVDEQAVSNAHRGIIRTLGTNQQVRWEDDGQDGGGWVRYTPGETTCTECNQVIDADGVCGRGGDGCSQGGA